jgi:hypothetical protein
MPSQTESSAAGEPGVQVSPKAPPVQVVLPVAVHAPTPQVVGTGMKSSSGVPLQSSSSPLQMESSAAGVPGVQLSAMTPLTQEVVPVEAQAPIPQDVGVEA